MQTDKRKRIAFYLFYSGLVLLVASLPLSKFMMSIAQFLIVGGWLLDGTIKEKFKKFYNSKPALVLASFYLLHIIGLIYTSDFIYAWKDLRIKLPLLILPLMLSSLPKITKSQFDGIMMALVGGVTLSTFISWLVVLGVIDRPVNDIRDISIFISHIRLALLCCLAFVAILWLNFRHRNTPQSKYYILLLPLLIWLLYFLIILESLTGLSILIITFILIIGWYLFNQRSLLLKVLAIIIVTATPVFIYSYMNKMNANFTDQQQNYDLPLESLTPSGNPYVNNTEGTDYENGNPLWIYICEIELEQQWNKRSGLNYAGKDQRNQEIKFTIMRFLTSKGLRKDSAGIWSLTAGEVHSIEKGIANVDYQRKGNIGIRIHQVLWELHHYRKTGDPSGHSVAQRLEFWKAATGIIKNNLLFGVGTGDTPKAFQDQYVTMQSKLSPEWRLRAHNQYLSIAVAFGFIGLGWFLFTLLYPLYLQIQRVDILYVSFSIISIVSMLTEDTLETQAGVTFFALFTSLFLFVNPNKSTAGVN